jgi:hypothetical protein
MAGQLAFVAEVRRMALGHGRCFALKQQAWQGVGHIIEVYRAYRSAAGKGWY